MHYLLASAEALVAMGEFDQAEELIVPKMAYFEHNASLHQLQADRDAQGRGAALG